MTNALSLSSIRPKNFNNSLPDLSSLKKLWSDQKEAAKSPPSKPTNEKKD